MKWWLIFPVILLVLLQTTVISFNFLLIFLLLVILLLGWGSDALWLAFLGGLALDLSAGTRLGLSSIAYLLSIGIVLLYGRKFQTKNVFFWMFLFVLCDGFFRLVTGIRWQPKDGLLMLGIALTLFLILDRLGTLIENDESIRLRF